MSGVAHLLCRQGYEVSGSDLQENENTQKLRKQPNTGDTK